VIINSLPKGNDRETQLTAKSDFDGLAFVGQMFCSDCCPPCDLQFSFS
jgi:hypothetical protein